MMQTASSSDKVTRTTIMPQKILLKRVAARKKSAGSLGECRNL